MATRNYSAIADQNIAASPGATVITLQSAVTVRPEVYAMQWGAGGTMADAAIQWLVRRFNTDDGTGTSVTARPLDTLDSASAITVQSNHTVEPSSFTMTLMDLYVHLRAVYYWNAAPGRGIILPGDATEGIGITPIHASQTNAVTTTVFFSE